MHTREINTWGVEKLTTTQHMLNHSVSLLCHNHYAANFQHLHKNLDRYPGKAQLNQ
jgi:hypothetical protein